MELCLWFKSHPRLELVQLRFERTPGNVRTSYRGKSLMFDRDGGLFQWSSAVKAFALLAVGSRIMSLQGTSEPYFLEGESGSPAASLDFAISKPTSWIIDLFGRDTSGKSGARVIFRRENSERKLPGPVRIALCAGLREPDALRIILDGTEIAATEELELIAQQCGAEAHSKAECKESSSLPVLNSNWFRKILGREALSALQDTSVLEEATIDLNINRLRSLKILNAASLDKLGAALKVQMPSEATRHLLPKVPQKLSHPLAVACPPTAIGALCILHDLALRFSGKVSVHSSYPSATAIIEDPVSQSLDALVLSWGAAMKMIKSGKCKEFTPLLLLPRTTLSLVQLNPHQQLSHITSVMCASDPAGYPAQLYADYKRRGIFASTCRPIPGNFSEIMSYLRLKADASIVGFPVSELVAKKFNAHVVHVEGPDLPIGDNILFVRSALPLKSLHQLIRWSWFRLIEDQQIREKASLQIFSDLDFVNYLYRLVALYQVSAKVGG